MQHGSIANRLQKQEALPNAIYGPDSVNWTALHEAVAAGDDKRVEVLLSSSSSQTDRLAKESNHGNTALHEAASRGFSRCVKLICAKPPQTSKEKSSINGGGKVKARVAATTTEALHNSTLGIINNEGLSALHLAAQNGHNQSSRELLLAGADPDVQNNYGDTPLHTACRYGHAGVTRILLSALCDPNKTNLNGDTALHITSAMGRRKLTRILLEADARLSIKNAQGDCPMHIAIRKNYREIIEILNTPRRIRNRKEKHSKEEKVDRNGERDKDRDSVDKGINWSPYGCHYFPDPRAFPSPKLETLPKEPLRPGEQYYLDLAGHIHKGQVSVGNTCYCGPFFRHIENKLNCNRKSLKKYVHKTKERLGHKVQALAIKTNDQIEQLTRTMIEDRLRCESKRQYLNEFLMRGNPQRHSTSFQHNRTTLERTLSRCRSLELLEKHMENRTMKNSRSVDGLEEEDDEDDQSAPGIGAAVEAIVHRTEEESEDNETEEDEEEDQAENPLPISTQDLSNDEHSKLDELKLDFLKVSERLGVLLEKTTLIMERDSEQEQKLPISSPLSSLSPPFKPSPDRPESLNHLREDKESDEYTHVLRRYPNSSETSNPSQNSWETCTPSPRYYPRFGRGENMLNSVIKALRKDAELNQEQEDAVKTAARNESLGERLVNDKLLYKEEANLKRQPLCLEQENLRHLPIMSNLFYSNPIREYSEEYASEEMEIHGNGVLENKVEIRNSEIKSLKKANNFHPLEATASTPSPTYSIPHRTAGHLVQQSQFGLPVVHATQQMPQNFVPKDAYFHELPHRRKIISNSGYLPNPHPPPQPNANIFNHPHPHTHGHPQPQVQAMQRPINEYVSLSRSAQHLAGYAPSPPMASSASSMAWQNRPVIGDLDLDDIGLYSNNVSSLV
ncbi:LOW QUALITY PROTEIN: uncharacterized protein dgo [Drosophila tropicalis]|uniref:LOW QUALITY PROTEIN: uncharacterized protein dgo n=1 Tax=Drosophila tropicalis TaxID=46794 RepID=UPI0035AB93FF